MNKNILIFLFAGILGATLFIESTNAHAETINSEKSPVSVSFVVDPGNGEEEFKPSAPGAEPENKPDNMVVNQDKAEKEVVNVVDKDIAVAAINPQANESEKLPQAGSNQMGITIPLLVTFFAISSIAFMKKSAWLND